MKEKFYYFVIRLRIPITIIFILSAGICAYARNKVSVNYDMNAYLPGDAPSTVAFNVMNEEFSGAIPNARVAIRNISYTEALEYKSQIEAIPGVESVTWLDDSNIFDMPLEMLKEDTVDDYYKDGTALYTVTIEEDSINSAVPAIRELIGEENAMTGSAVSTAIATASTVKEVKKMAIVAVLFVLFMLTITTTSWAEPIIVLLGIGVAVLINSGSNLVFGEISFVTNAAGNILQLAVSLDYSVFLIHRFEECRKEFSDPKEAMLRALCKSTSSILSSGLTTVIGFLALLFMRFQIGPDLGRALAKGIGISLLTVFVFMPGLILFCYKLMDKTVHKSLLSSFEKTGLGIQKITPVIAVLLCLLIIPSYYCSNRNSFYYGASHIFGVGTQYGDDTSFIESTFGIKDTYVLMVPNTSNQTERALCEDLKEWDEIISVTSLADMMGPSIPVEIVPDAILSKLRSKNYSRIVLSMNAEYEGDETFALVERVRAKVAEYYGDTYYLAGQGVSTYDLMDTITADMVKVNLVAIGAVFIVLLLSMRSLILPIILVLTIETSIWINLTIPYIQGKPIFYIAYLIISSVQLGATVDYAILFTDRYKEVCENYSGKEAIVITVKETIASLLTSGLVLTVIGFLMGIISTHGLLSQLGYLLGKGTICSLIAVVMALPGLLYVAIGRKNKNNSLAITEP